MANQPGWFDKTKTFFAEVRVEMGKVVWPTPQQAKKYTAIVIGSTAVIAIVMGLWDAALGLAVTFIFG